MTSGLRYYIEDFSDEVVPCDCTPEGWAEWLSKPDEGWERYEPAKDGERFKADVTRYGDDIVVSLRSDGIPALSFRPERASFFALRFGPGLGWDAENIIGYSLDDLDGWLIDPDNLRSLDDGDHIAVGYEEPAVMLVYHADGPRISIEPIDGEAQQ